MSACMLKRCSEASKETISKKCTVKHAWNRESEVFFSDLEHAAMVWYVVCLTFRFCYQNELLTRRLLIKYNHALKGKPF